MKRFFSLVILLFCQTASSQYISNINPANTGDPRVVFANPAAMAFSAPYVVAGYQNLYSGLSALNNSMVGLVYPTPRYGSFAVTGQNFMAPMFSRTAFDLRYAYHVDRFRTSVGMNIGTLSTAYDRGQFQGVDMNDPLLNGDLSLNTLNIGLGITSELYENLILGFSVDHLNKPSISLQDEFKKDTHLRTGLTYRLGHFRPLALWEFDENEHYITIGSEYWFNQINNPDINVMARGFVSAEYFTLGAGLIYKNIRLDYLFDYPMNDLSAFAGGTHQFVAAYTLGQNPLPRPVCKPPKAVCVALDKVLKVDPHKNIPQINAENPQFKIGDNLFEIGGTRYQVLNFNAHPFTNYLFFQADEQLDEYSANLYKELKQFLHHQQHVDVDLISYFLPDMPGHQEATRQRAFLLYQYLGEQLEDSRLHLEHRENPRFRSLPNDVPIAREEQRIKIDYKNLTLFHASDSVCTFDLSNSKADCGWKRWQIIVYRKTASGDMHRIWLREGDGKPPERVSWVWTRSLKSLADLNQTYTCRLLIEDKKGRIDLSEPDYVFTEFTPSAMPKKYVLLFPFDRQEVTLDGPTADLLRSIAHFHKDGQLVIDQVIGYTDTTGISAHNNTLSLNRAETIHNYLIDYLETIGANTTIAKPPQGYGENQAYQLFPSDTPQGRWMNRRVEIVVRPTQK